MGKKKGKGKSTGTNEFSLIKFFSGIIKEIGIPGFLVTIVVFIFLTYSSADQKREFIDRFILLKSNGEEFKPCIIIVVILLLIIVTGSIYFRKTIQLMKKENNRIGKEKSELQSALINKNLHSSNQ